MVAHSFHVHVLFCVVFQKFYAIVQKFCTLVLVYPKYLQVAGVELERTAIRIYTSATLRYPPLLASL